MTDENKAKQKYLKQYHWAQNEINNWESNLGKLLDDETIKSDDKLDHWISRANKLTSSISDLPSGGTPLGLDGAVAEYILLQSSINQEIVGIIREKIKKLRIQIKIAEQLTNDIEKSIDNVEDGRLRILLKLRYIEGLKWEAICCDMNYSWQMIHLLHNKALSALSLD